MSSTLILAAVIAGGVILLGIMILVAYSRLFVRAKSDEAIVRTGKGGMQAVAGGGMWVIPIFHEAQRVTLRQIKIPIDRTGEDALVAKNYIKADVKGTMYVRVGDTPEDIKQAAKALEQIDDRTINAMIAGKVTDAMRAEAMKLDYSELHVKKQAFSEAIGDAVREDLRKTGLVLDTVAIESIQQVVVDPTNIPMDVFEAQGAKQVVQVVEAAKEETNRIRREKQVQIQQVDVDARKKSLGLDMDQKKAEADQSREVADYEAQQATKARQAVLEQQRIAEEASIAKDEEVAKRNIAREKALAIEASAKREADEVAQQQAAQAIETATIAKSKAIETATIAKQREVEAAEIEKRKTIETAEIEKQRAIAEAKELEAQAEAKQAAAEALEEAERQKIKTVEETAVADRAKQVAILKAEEQARQEVIEAEAQRDSRQAKAQAEAVEAEQRAIAARNEAQGRADAVKISAEAHANDVSIRAEADANAATLQAQAKKELAAAQLAEGEAAAESRRLLVEAENAVSRDLLVQRAVVELVKVSPQLVHEFMSPAAAISDVKVLNLQGLGGGEGVEGSANGNGQSHGLPGLITNSLAQAAGLTPVVQAILGFLKDSGLSGKLAETKEQLVEEVRRSVGAPEVTELPAHVLEQGQESRPSSDNGV